MLVQGAATLARLRRASCAPSTPTLMPRRRLMDVPTLGRRSRRMVVAAQREREQGAIAGREKEGKGKRES